MRDHGHAAATQIADLVVVELQDVLAIKQYLATGNYTAGTAVSHKGAGQGRFSATAFTDDPKGLAGLNLETHPIDSHCQVAGRWIAVSDLEVADIEKRHLSSLRPGRAPHRDPVHWRGRRWRSSARRLRWR